MQEEVSDKEDHFCSPTRANPDHSEHFREPEEFSDALDSLMFVNTLYERDESIPILDKSFSAFSVCSLDLFSEKENGPEPQFHYPPIEDKPEPRTSLDQVIEDNGKLVFKIVRVDRKTKQERVLTKSR